MCAGTRVPALLQRHNIGRLLTLRALLHFEAYLLVFLQRFEATSLDFRKMREQVFAATVRRNETKALCIVKPLHCTCCHFPEFSKKDVVLVPLCQGRQDATFSFYHKKMAIHNQGRYRLSINALRLGATPRSVKASVSVRRLFTRAAKAAALACDGNGSKA